MREPAPPDVNLVEFVADLALTHDALHPGEPLYLREALAVHGVEAAHVTVPQTVGNLRRRHGPVGLGERLRHRLPHIEEDDDGTLLEYPPKNGKARTVPLPAAACDELRVWHAAQKEYRLAQGPAWNEAGRVVLKKVGSQMAPSTLKSQWWNWVARQKIEPHLPIHVLRDSFGTRVYETYAVKQRGSGSATPTRRH
jgi:integrase